ANNCPKLWRDFMERHTEIENVISTKESCGLMCTGEEDFIDGKFDYIASLAVSDLERIPEGMVGAEVPEATYAVFTHTGKLTHCKIPMSTSMESGFRTPSMNRLV
ncbi:effector binding domain-containing protein, partial [Mesotoga sp.]|uniref:GyrI-like domain-containing protein n=1 Tax=Mesotoga sp. TaxID=2053577 RepID=UPI002C2812B8